MNLDNIASILKSAHVSIEPMLCTYSTVSVGYLYDFIRYRPAHVFNQRC